jgi:drug/metabolite transporter (DMT)-like permease
MWLLPALSAYLINAGVYVADKFILSKKIHSSIVYTFYVGIWSIFNAAILIFAPWAPSMQELVLDLSAGFLFLFTLLFWYKALHQSEATRVVPIVGALVPIFSFVLSAIFFAEELGKNDVAAFFILVFGGVLMSVKKTKFYRLKMLLARIFYLLGRLTGDIRAEARPTERLIVNSAVSAFFFAAFYVLMKYIYLHQPFIGSFVWSRFGSFLGALLILAVPSWRKKIKEHSDNARQPKSMAFFLTVRLLAAAAFILLNYAISQGSVAMVNALQGSQYLFLIVIVAAISWRHPKMLDEELGRGILVQKMIGVGLVSMGLWMLVG